MTPRFSDTRSSGLFTLDNVIDGDGLPFSTRIIDVQRPASKASIELADRKGITGSMQLLNGPEF
jgi:hypothetical protein